jgi:hypothetical protein
MWKEALFLCALASLCWLPGCGEPEGGGGPAPTPAPCGGACPASACVFNVCVGGGDDLGQPDQGADVALDQGEEVSPDLPDADLVEDLTPDLPPEDMGEDLGEDAPPDLPPEDLGEDAEDVGDVPLEGCAADEDCPERQYCDLSQGGPRGECADGCRDDAGCGRGRICQERACVRGCREDEVCAGRSYCDPETLTCQEGCREGNCPEGAACDLEARVCVQGACTVSADCAVGFYCDTALAQPLCVEGCDTDARCDGLRCESSLNRCVCDRDAQCTPGEVCQSGRCEPPCDTDEDCAPGSFCDPFVRVCAEGCLDDNFEPNNEPLFARPLGGEAEVEGRVCLDPVFPAPARDCYALPQEDAAWALRLEADPAAPLALVAYLEEGEEGERAALSQGVASLTLQTGFDRGAVFCVEPSRVVELALSYRLAVARRCLGDAQDAAGDEVCATALGGAAPLSLEAPLSVDGRRLCPEDVDHVSFSMQAGEVASVSFSSSGFGDDAPLVEVLGASCGAPLLALEAGFFPSRQADFEAPAAGVYTLRVTSRAPSEAGWSATVSLQPPPCREDRLQGEPLEPNNSAQAASPLPTRRGAVFGLGEARLCEGDEDWYAVEVVGGDLLRAALTVDGEDAPVSVEIYNPTGRIRLATGGAEGLERVAQTANLGQAGRYLVRVSAASIPASGLRYGLSVLTAGQVRCAPDGFEGNDSAQEAALLGSGAHRGVICGGDADWFRLPLRAGERVTMSWVYDHDLIAPLEQLVGTLYGPSGPEDLRDFFLTDGLGNTDRLSGAPMGFQVAPADEGAWLLALEPGDWEEALDYTLLVSVEAPACGADDEQPRDDGCAMARALAQGEEVSGEVCGAIGDEDWYAVTAQAGQRLEVELEHFHFDGNLELELYAPGGQTLADFSYNAGPNEEFVSASDVEAGAWCVRVFTRSAQVQNSYTLRATAQ